MREFFTSKKVSDSLYIIRESYCDVSGFTLGLAVGTEKAAVIDSGLGAVEGLRAHIETLTDRPVICLATHGHPDHAGGAIQFDEVYLSELDAPELTWGLTRERRLGDLVDFSRNDAEVLAYADKHCLDCTNFRYTNMKDGDVFDLGGSELEVLAMPGHTAGSMALVNRKEKYIFTGDAVSETLMVTGYERRYLEESYQALRRLVAVAQELGVTTLYAAHYEEPLPLQVAIDLRDACEEVLAGKTGDDERTHFKYAEMNDPDIVLMLHKKNGVGVTYNAAAVEGA